MLTNIIDRLGEYNPQLFRELKGRLSGRNIILTVILSIAVQIITLLWFIVRLPEKYIPKDVARKPVAYYWNEYCAYHPGGMKYEGGCYTDQLGQIIVNWDKWRLDLFIGLSWMIPGVLIVGGIYLLISDLEQEKKRGTLNFISLTPQRPHEIFIGKLIGVPILVFLGAFLAIPFHIFASFQTSLNLGGLVSWYLVVTTLTIGCYLTAILYVLIGGSQAILTTGLMSFGLFLPGFIINRYFYAFTAYPSVSSYGWESIQREYLSWFGIPITNNLLVCYSFTSLTIAFINFILWQAVNRRYLNPTATLISKDHSYFITFLLQGFLIGFSSNIFHESDNRIVERLSLFFFINFVWFSILMPSLIPTKQRIVDWSRYHHLDHQPAVKEIKGVVNHLLFHEHSPAIITYGVNLLIAVICWLPIVIININNHYLELKVLLGIALAVTLMLMYASIAQLVMFSKLRKRQLWAMSMVGGTAILPIILSTVTQINSSVQGISAIFMLFSPMLWVSIHNVTAGMIFYSLIGQLGAVAGLNLWFHKQLNTLGSSQTKALLGA
jgi:hypothetical protein